MSVFIRLLVIRGSDQSLSPRGLAVEEVEVGLILDEPPLRLSINRSLLLANLGSSPRINARIRYR